MTKYKIAVFILFIVISLSLIKVNAYIYDFPLLGKIIYIDPGHGGIDPGAMYGDVLEKDINLIISKKIGHYLEEMGATTYYTRTDDYDLAEINANQRKRSDLGKRAQIINEAKANMYISIHLNAYSSAKWRGFQIFYDDVNPQNKIIAESLTNYVKNSLDYVREVKIGKGYYMYQRINVPGVLIEVGFISNDNERYLLKQNNYQTKVAKVIANAINNYFQS